MSRDGTTALGGDDRTGCAVLVALAETLIKHKLPHPPITLLFTVREESGLHGARELNPAGPRRRAMCINVDGQLASELIIGAVGQENWEVEIKGKASHAGVAPEKGISATLVGAVALAEAQRAGWFGKVVKPRGTAPAMSAFSAARTARRPATRPTSSPTTPSSRARRAARGCLRDQDRRRLQARPSTKAQDAVTDDEGDTAR